MCEISLTLTIEMIECLSLNIPSPLIDYLVSGHSFFHLLRAIVMNLVMCKNSYKM